MYGCLALYWFLGVFAVYEITKRIKQGNLVDNDRLATTTSISPLDYMTVNGKKRKVPEFSFLDQDSILVSNKDYLGKVYVVDFFFTTCPTICPVMTHNLVELQEMFKDENDFGIASFTINPRYDKPAVLKKYAKRYGITDTDWHLMTGAARKDIPIGK